MKYLTNYVTDPIAVKKMYDKCSQIIGTAIEIRELKLLINDSQHLLQLQEENQNIANCKWIGELYTLQNREGWVICSSAGDVQYTSVGTALYPWNCQWPQGIALQLPAREIAEPPAMGQQLQSISTGVESGVQELRQVVANRKGELIHTGDLNTCVQHLDDLSYTDIHSFELQARSLLGTGSLQIQNYQKLLQALQKFGADWKNLFSDDDWYKCIAVNREAGTWTGTRMQIVKGSLQPSWQSALSITSQRKFTYFIPSQGQIWNGSCTIQIANHITSTSINKPQDTAFYLALDNASKSGESYYPSASFGTGWYVPRDRGIDVNKEVGNRKCLYLNNNYSAAYVNTGGSLLAKDATTANTTTGCSARYGYKHPDGFTYSFLFYPDMESEKGLGSLFCLGYYYNNKYNRRFVLQYNDTNKTFLMKSTQNQAMSTQQAGYAEKGMWHHICITNNGKQSPEGEYKLYVDGKYTLSFKHPSQWIPTQPYTNGNINLGGYYRYNSSDYPHAVGGYANLRWYNRPLYPNEILALAQEAKGGN